MADSKFGKALRRFLRIVSAQSGGLTDSQLLDAYATQGDEEAFETLLWRHGPMVLRTCQRILRRREDAEDAFQATFLVLCRKARSISTGAALGGWLYKVAYRTALQARAQAARPTAAQPLPADQPARDPAAEALDRELRAVLDEELNRLAEKYRAPLVLCYLEGKTKERAAQELGWPAGTVSGRLARGKELLRLRLIRRGVSLSTAALTAALTQNAAAGVFLTPLTLATTKAVLEFNTGRGVVAGAVSSKVVILAQGVLQAMLWTKLKIATGVLLAVGIAAASTGLVTHYVLAEKETAEAQPNAPKPAVKAADLPKPKPAEEKQVRTDRYGDPLPEGAIARMGTIRLRTDGQVAAVAFSPDGKMVYSLDSLG
jgi:RNA polymerase sigma factor (sigma-70 family)